MDKYIENAILHGEGTETGDYKKVNEAFDNIVNNYNIIKKQDPSLESFIPLLNHENDSVRSWTAFFLLRSKETLAVKTLEDIASAKGPVVFVAKITLKEWKKGILDFNFLD